MKHPGCLSLPCRRRDACPMLATHASIRSERSDHASGLVMPAQRGDAGASLLRTTRPCVAALCVAIAVLILVSTAAASTPGSCSAASATPIASGSTQSTNARACRGEAGLQYWAMNLQVGDTLTVNGTPTTSGLSVGVYGPNVQTIGEPLCSSGESWSPFT